MSDSGKSGCVLIVGGGPVGVLSALMLARQGVPSVILERRADRSLAPKAHAINPRSLEILKAAGIDLASVYAVQTPPEDSQRVRFVAKVAGDELGSLPYERQDLAVRDLTPSPLINIAQPDLELLLLALVANEPKIELRYRHEWLSCEHVGDMVKSRIMGPDGEYDTEHRFIIACDGAGSRVRRELGIEMLGDSGIVHTVNIHFRADLRPLVGDRSAILYWVLDPGATGTFIVYDLSSNIVFSHRYDPTVESAEDFPLQRCRGIVEAAIGAPMADLEILSANPWVMAAQVAARYRCGNVFLAGDAAHRFPPTGGLGLNTGIADVQNLTWKIGAVVNGWAAEALLDTYEQERQPVAMANSQQSLINANRLIPLFDLVAGAQADNAPAFAERLADPGFRQALSKQIAAQREHFDSLGLQLGYVYGSHGAEADRPIADVSLYHPSFETGARMPHAWVSGPDGEISVQDLLSDSAFTLIVGAEDRAWRTAAETLSIPVNLRVAGREFTDLAGEWSRQSGIAGGGAVLVRPDGHVALQADGPAQAEARLREAVAGFQPVCGAPPVTANS